jgi:hypothetical protein
MTFCDPKRLQQEDCYLIKTFQFKKDDKYADEITKFNRDSNSLINAKVFKTIEKGTFHRSMDNK